MMRSWKFVSVGTNKYALWKISKRIPVLYFRLILRSCCNATPVLYLFYPQEMPKIHVFHYYFVVGLILSFLVPVAFFLLLLGEIRVRFSIVHENTT